MEDRGELRTRDRDDCGFSHILAVYRGDSDREALDCVIDIAGVGNARVTLAVPIETPSAWAHLASYPFEQLQDELTAEARGLALEALKRVPDWLAVSARLVPQGDEGSMVGAAVDEAPDLVVCARRARRLRRGVWERAACAAGIPVVTVPKAHSAARTNAVSILLMTSRT
jgi:nucleotide-binding universal stress UspA family protein